MSPHMMINGGSLHTIRSTPAAACLPIGFPTYIDMGKAFATRANDGKFGFFFNRRNSEFITCVKFLRTPA
jgi:hypothetical protein